MSERIAHAERRRELLNHMILQLHSGEAPDQVRARLVRVLGQVPYDDVVAIEPYPEHTPSGFINSRYLDDKAGVAVILAKAPSGAWRRVYRMGSHR